MDTVYFNELSIDGSYSVLPNDLASAKSSLVKFINICLGYILAKGVGHDLALSVTNNLSFGKIPLHNDYSINRILNELVDDGIIEWDEKKRFQSFTGESFTSNWEPEFQFDNIVVYGLGEAYLKNSYALSFDTKFINKPGGWHDFFYVLLKIPANGPEVSIKAHNISTLSHIFHQLEIWKHCNFKNESPNNAFLPNKYLCNLIPQCYGMKSFHEYYSNQQRIDITVKKNIGTISAIVNGWLNCSPCPSQHRLVFSAKNYYLTIDTENSTFEVYKGKNDHQGEIYFNDDKVNSSKKNPKRGVCGRKGHK